MANATETNASAASGASESATAEGSTTQATQYDRIGKKYNVMHELPAVQPEKPSVLAALGDLTGKMCLDLACGTGRYTALLASLGAYSVHGYDISKAMIDAAISSYPAATNPALQFGVADCSKSESLPYERGLFDIIFAGWFLNYAGTESDLIAMFNVIAFNLKDDGRFVGITTNVHDKFMHCPKPEFYGLDIAVLDSDYVSPDTGNHVGIVARVRSDTEPVVEFDVFQFRKDVYERCAFAAGLRLNWRDPVVPEDERRNSLFWTSWLERPTFSIIEATKL